jgi:dinuclear metal center YbgI/SA1388 family protein
MKVADLVRVLEETAPLAYAEEWDNVGLLAGDPDAAITRALLAIDCTREVIDEAAHDECQVVVAYHPPIFRPMTRVTRGSIAYDLVRRNIAVYSPHTALDAADGGTNDVLADAVGMDATTRVAIRASATKDTAYKLVTFVPSEAVARLSEALFEAGAGRIGDYRSCSFRSSGTGTFFGEPGTTPAVGRAGKMETVDEVRLEAVVPIGRAAEVVRALRGAHPYEEPAFDLVRLANADASANANANARRGMGRIGDVVSIDRAALVTRVKERLDVDHVLVAGPSSGAITRVAVCAGSAGDLLDAAIELGAQAIVTGEVRHHDALRAAARGVTVICALHSNSERIALAPLATRLRAALPGVTVTLSTVDRDPFVIA